MSIAASGAISFADLRSEFTGGTGAISINDLYRGGSNIKSKEGDNSSTNLAASVPTSGTIDIADFHGTAKGFKATISSSTTNVDVNALFGGDYDTNYPKVVDINSGVTIGGSGDEAIDIPSGLAGGLTINNAGTVIGFGGASAGAAGGSAINCASSGVTINNTGQISGGGGAGNVGGTGGNGASTTTTNNTNTNSNYWFVYGSENCGGANNQQYIYYGGYGQINGVSGTSHSASGVVFLKGSYSRQSDNGEGCVSNLFIVNIQSSAATTGGAGGSFGVGAGFNQSLTNGGSGLAGGTSAGSGGAGSNGANLGTAATTSTAGANGNASNGAAGNAGGAAGAAVSGTSVQMNNTGTLNGAVA